MAVAIISSHEEFRLLLSKWMSESKEVFVVISCREGMGAPVICMSVVLGTITSLDDERMAIKDQSGNAASVLYRDCKFVYEAEFGSWGATNLTGKHFHDVFVLETPAGTQFSIGSTSVTV
jgi:hypothetical protein